LFKNICSDFCQTNNLNIYQNDLHEIGRICKTFTAYKRSEVIFFDPSRDVAVATNFQHKINLRSTPCSSHDIRKGGSISIQQERQLLCRVQANKLPDSMDAGEPIK